MSIPANGPVSFSQLRAAFGTGNSGPISMSSYYNNAPAAFTTGVPGVPATGNTISMSCFVGKSKPVVMKGVVRIYYLNADDTSAYNADVKSKILAYASATYPTKTVTFTIDYMGANLASLTTSNYDVVMVSSYSSYPGANWASYIESFVAAGGGLVLAAFANAGKIIHSFVYSSYSPIQNIPGSNDLGGYHTLGEVVAHPITSGLTNFDAGITGFGGNNVALNSGATPLATYTNGTSLIAVQTFGNSRTVNLNFFPPSSAVDYYYWTGQGGLIMANACLWAAHGL
jgi:hypothetical protein